ncbi:MAG: ring-cleaving dioxygenase [Bosea sp.]|uniref:VOC family protein n=1 Tax=Bosea sp. (in: a-proteobacteria) TaxID=1871050 RepID=UPI00239CD3F8|nr:ring-cleaving dioxygenase [Bosea sp. (in: a-proteobacteria)]MCP4735889.1 ring-cleaving dioxygenase [Bosea sp. (in: a-proteobacteria)]
MTGRGLHHVTAIATNASCNLDFYTGVLGLRLVKRTVTHEDPGAYHLIYGDEEGSPGSRLSFFSWVSAVASGRSSSSEYVSFAVAPEAIGWWEARLAACKVPCRQTRTSDGCPKLMLEDPDRTPLALIGSELAPGTTTWSPPDIPEAFAVRALHGVTLSLRGTELMARLLTQVLGFAEVASASDQLVFSAHGGPGGRLCLHRRGGRSRPRLGAGVIHHVAFRARDEADLAVMAGKLQETFGIVASPAKDRHYFRSIYFRGPDGILIEIATDGPGFLIDETRETLGTRLIFPPSLQDRQDELLRILPPLDRVFSN